ncbi:hypothetical protein [Amycolatopsis sp. NPDC059657]|uniref:hypothetical protein n=1 Tax=Amycolatopsis sp. NPDC059657 TaxID=3346899 RepID=UPI0036706EEB
MPNMTRIALLTGLLAMVVSCGSEDAGMQPTITIDEANQRVDDYITRALKVLPATKLELNSQELAGDCSDPTDHGPKGRVTAERSYKLIDLPETAKSSHFASLRTWWLANNFRILSDTPPNEFLWVENNADGFQMTLKAHPGAGVFLLAGSPCVWRGGKPDPTAQGSQHGVDSPAQVKPTPQALPPPSASTKAAHSRRPRRKPVDDAEDFDQTDCTDDQIY